MYKCKCGCGRTLSINDKVHKGVGLVIVSPLRLHTNTENILLNVDDLSDLIDKLQQMKRGLLK